VISGSLCADTVVALCGSDTLCAPIASASCSAGRCHLPSARSLPPPSPPPSGGLRAHP
jgi:hypothetical protein